MTFLTYIINDDNIRDSDIRFHAIKEEIKFGSKQSLQPHSQTSFSFVYTCRENLVLRLANLNHGSQLATISLIAAKDIQPRESPQRKLEERFLCYPWR